MNIQGHHDVAKKVGIPLLEEAFEKARKGSPRLTAFYLGNWLADISQVKDPVSVIAPSALKEHLRDVVDNLVDEIKDRIHFKNGNEYQLYKIPKQVIRLAKRELHALIDKLVSLIREPEEKGQGGIIIPNSTKEKNQNGESEWTTLLREGTLIVGYFKFVHPKKSGDKPGLSFENYKEIFEQRFTQYYPHEHLDRPPILPFTNPILWSSEVSSKKRNSFAIRSKSPDLYSYLRDDIEMVAATLAELDKDWAKQTFDEGTRINDDDLEWNLNLAKLGFALHAVEDFFAHSNFTELAVHRFKGEFLPKDYQILDSQTFKRRLKRYIPASFEQWENYPDEHDVVTGYFDDIDTIIGIAHVLEEIVGPPLAWTIKKIVSIKLDHSKWLDPDDQREFLIDEIYSYSKELRDPARIWRMIEDAIKAGLDEILLHPEDIDSRFNRILSESAEIVEDFEKALNDPDNGTAQAIKKNTPIGELLELKENLKPPVNQRDAKRLTEGLGKLAKIVFAKSDLFKSIPSEWKNEIRERFIPLLVAFNNAYWIGDTAYSLYGHIKSLIELFNDPGDWIAKFIVKNTVLRAIGTTISGALFISREKFYDFLGQKRIGCHSLLAKDHGREWLYETQKNFAKAVHWYVLNAMTRWADPEFIKKARATNSPEWIDWLELLEFYLSNPLSDARISQRIPIIKRKTITHEVAKRPRGDIPDTLGTLSQRYLSSTYDPGFYNSQYEYWERIADENFNTFDLPREQRIQVINHVLEAAGIGYPVAPPNFAFKPGTVVYIPDQKSLEYVVTGQDEENLWFKGIMDNMSTFFDRDGWKLIMGVDNRKRKSERPNFHKPKFITEKQLSKIIISGNNLRKQAEDAYSSEL
ncbi:hypothetical protein L0337_17755 [candidate division KSB1 bacterium]|nr:hypothetical protein [candidate division KSB1 bacterium]